MTPTDPLAADDAIVAKALRYAQIEDSLDTPAICAIADKRGRALRELMAHTTLEKHVKGEYQGNEGCDLCGWSTWPCPDAQLLARIREILGGE